MRLVSIGTLMPPISPASSGWGDTPTPSTGSSSIVGTPLAMAAAMVSPLLGPAIFAAPLRTPASPTVPGGLTFPSGGGTVFPGGGGFPGSSGGYSSGPDAPSESPLDPSSAPPSDAPLDSRDVVSKELPPDPVAKQTDYKKWAALVLTAALVFGGMAWWDRIHR